MVILKSESTVRPIEWDLTSSQVYVYHNINIVEIPATEDKPLHYEYDVEKYSLNEYQAYANERQHNMEAALIELAAMVAGG